MCCGGCDLLLVFFFKQKTAYEVRISDWSSDVCSSDLRGRRRHRQGRHRLRRPHPRRAAQHLREAPQGPALTPASNGVRHHSTRPGGGTLRRSPYQERKLRSEERRVRTECFSTCSSRWSPYHLTKNTIQLSKPLT